METKALEETVGKTLPLKLLYEKGLFFFFLNFPLIIDPHFVLIHLAQFKYLKIKTKPSVFSNHPHLAPHLCFTSISEDAWFSKVVDPRHW